MGQDAKTRLLNLLPQLKGTLTFFPKGEERPLAHHKSQRLPHEIYAGAELSPYYCSLRTPTNQGDKQGSLTPEALALEGECLLGLIIQLDAREDVQAIAGIPNAGDPLAEAVIAAARHQGYALQSARFAKSEGQTGTCFTRVPGVSELPVDVVVDDVITLADTKVRFLAALGKKPRAICILFNREEGGVEVLRQLGYSVYWVFGLTDVLLACRKAELIDDETVARSHAYAVRRRELVNDRMDEILADLRAHP